MTRTTTQQEQAEYLALIFLSALGYPGPSVHRAKAADTLTYIDDRGVVMIRDEFLFEEGLEAVADVYKSISHARYRPHPNDLPPVPGRGPSTTSQEA